MSLDRAVTEGFSGWRAARRRCERRSCAVGPGWIAGAMKRNDMWRPAFFEECGPPCVFGRGRRRSAVGRNERTKEVGFSCRVFLSGSGRIGERFVGNLTDRRGAGIRVISASFPCRPYGDVRFRHTDGVQATGSTPAVCVGVSGPGCSEDAGNGSELSASARKRKKKPVANVSVDGFAELRSSARNFTEPMEIRRATDSGQSVSGGQGVMPDRFYGRPCGRFGTGTVCGKPDAMWGCAIACSVGRFRSWNGGSRKVRCEARRNFIKRENVGVFVILRRFLNPDRAVLRFVCRGSETSAATIFLRRAFPYRRFGVSCPFSSLSAFSLARCSCGRVFTAA